MSEYPESWDEGMTDDSSFNTDFDVESEYKPEPLAIGGNYFGTIKEVKMDYNTAAVVFTIVLDGNDGVTCNDGETPVDGLEVQSRLWLPRPNDKNELNKRGTMSKYQSKINMMKQFMDRTGLDIGSFDKIKAAIEETEWIGIPVVAKVTVETYQGRQFNRCDQFSRREE